MTRNLIIIGSGPAGWTAALYAARAALAPLIFTGPEPGGQLTTTSEVENFPGFPKGIEGPELMKLLREQAERFGAEAVEQSVERVDFSGEPKKIWSGGVLYETKTAIIATGASAKRLGLASEKALYGKGVSACATCDGFFFRGKEVIVVGGGDAAMEEAGFLTRFAGSVTIVHRRDAFRASKIMQERVLANPKISVVWNTVVEEILGVEAGRVTGVKLKNLVTGEISEKKIDGVFAAIGHEPNTKIFAGQLALDEKGYVVTDGRTTVTSVSGVFAAGDAADHRYRQAVTAAGTGCMAALDVEKFLAAG
ncbi:thioredoxin-disulfide reductase [Patescibacteria group bacterium]|nr:MAG: thioredoxin-disulfide reductase [Patescibacteria group bacterium]